MYSGIVETTAIITNNVLKNECKVFTLALRDHLCDIKVGDSISVNGVCTTVSHLTGEKIQFTAVPETLQKTNLNYLTAHDEVNIERSITMSTRLGGHIVSGHVDATAEVIGIKDAGDAKLLHFKFSEALMKYIVNKGFIAIDGMSLTVIDTTKNTFTVTLIPHTQSATIAKNYLVGSIVNIEVDTLAKYIEKITGAAAHAHTYSEC